MPIPVLPDVVGLTITALLGQGAVTALVGTRIYDRVPTTPTYPLIAVMAVSDAEADAAIGTARVQLDVWGRGGSPTNVVEARTIALVIRSIARDIRGSYSGGVIVSCAPDAFIPAFDPDTGRARFILDCFIDTHA